MIRLTLGLPPAALWPNSRAHRMAKARATREARALAWAHARKAVWEPAMARYNPPMWERAQTRVTFYFATNRRRDEDSAAAAMKAFWDGIADAGVVVNDAGFTHLPPELRVDRANPRVEIEIARSTKSGAAPLTSEER